MYIELLIEMVQHLEASVGPGRALKALDLAHPLTPPEGVTDYDSRLRLWGFLEGQKAKPDKEIRNVVLSSLNDGEKYLIRYREELLRQARTAFNAAVAFVLVGATAIIGGVVLLYADRIATGALSSTAGILANVASRPFFRLSREANKRLDKVAAGIEKWKSLRARFDGLSKSEAQGRGRER